jgi:hypothetical protein
MSDEKDFSLIANSTNTSRPSKDFNKMRIDGKTYRDDVTLDISKFNKHRARRIRKHDIEKALERREIKELRAVSNYYFIKSGIYSRLCRYMAYLYRYD